MPFTTLPGIFSLAPCLLLKLDDHKNANSHKIQIWAMFFQFVRSFQCLLTHILVLIRDGRYYFPFFQKWKSSYCCIMSQQSHGVEVTRSLDVSLMAPSPGRSFPYRAAAATAAGSCWVDRSLGPGVEVLWSPFLFDWGCSSTSSLKLILVEVPPATAFSLGLQNVWQTNFLIQVMSSVFRA